MLLPTAQVTSLPQPSQLASFAPAAHPIQRPASSLNRLPLSSTFPFAPSSILAVVSSDDSPKHRAPLPDTVQRVIDSTTIQLVRTGYVTLAAVRGAGSTYVLPECMDKAPAYKLRGMLGRGAAVQVYDLSDQQDSGSTGKKPRVWIVRSSDGLAINRELVRTGYAFVRKGGGGDNNKIDGVGPEVIRELNELERNARRSGLGIFKICDGSDGNKGDDATATSATVADSNFVAQFEPLEYITQTQWLDDGGKTILVPKEQQSTNGAVVGAGGVGDIIPNNPGDTVGCSDFTTYEDALAYYEFYLPYYGDVAKLDRNGNGLPCRGLPHTKNMERYRMKRPVGGGAGGGALVDR